MLRRLAFRLGPVRHREDAVQEALLRIFQQIGNVDLKRESTARTYLMNAGVFAIRTFNSKIMRQTRDDHKPTERSSVVRDPEIMNDLPPVLALYLDHIAAHGTVMGAHKAVGDKLGIGKVKAFRLFHKEAARFMEGL